MGWGVGDRWLLITEGVPVVWSMLSQCGEGSTLRCRPYVCGAGWGVMLPGMVRSCPAEKVYRIKVVPGESKNRLLFTPVHRTQLNYDRL